MQIKKVKEVFDFIEELPDQLVLEELSFEFRICDYHPGGTNLSEIIMAWDPSKAKTTYIFERGWIGADL